MINKFWLGIFVFMLVVPFVSVALPVVDKPILEIDNCMNLSFKVTDVSGDNTQGYGFRNCQKKDGLWICDCLKYSKDGIFQLNLTSNNVSKRVFVLELNYSQYFLDNHFDKIRYLDNIKVSNSSIQSVERNFDDFCPKNITVIINNTVYKEVPVYINVSNNSTLSKEDVSNMDYLINKYKHRSKIFIITTIILTIIILLGSYLFYKTILED